VVLFVLCKTDLFDNICSAQTCFGKTGSTEKLQPDPYANTVCNGQGFVQDKPCCLMKRELQTAIEKYLPKQTALRFKTSKDRSLRSRNKGGTTLSTEQFAGEAPYVSGNKPWGDITARSCVCAYLFQKAMWAWSKVAYPEDGNCVTVCPQPDIAHYDESKHTLDLCVTFDTTDGATGTGTKNAAATNAEACNYKFKSTALADYAGAFAVSGTPTKTIHFFWWGNPTSEKHKTDAFKGPKAWIAKAPTGYQIKYWHDESAAGVTDAELGIVEDSCGQRQPIAGTQGIADMCATIADVNAPEVKAVLDMLIGQGLYTAVKDLAVLCILHQHGGFLFDCGAYPLGADDGAQAASLTAATFTNRCPVYVTDPKCGLGYKTFSLGGVNQAFAEVNLMYHPPSSTYTAGMVKLMMQIYSGMEPAKPKAEKSPDAKEKFASIEGANKKAYIGEQITFASVYGLYNCHFNNNVDPSMTYWYGEQGTQEEVDIYGGSIVKALVPNVLKVYGGNA
jgi:hypothetical protein